MKFGEMTYYGQQKSLLNLHILDILLLHTRRSAIADRLRDALSVEILLGITAAQQYEKPHLETFT